MSIEIFKENLNNSIGSKRLKHSTRVMDTAIELARIYGVPVKKARIAAILHDCGRIKGYTSLEEYFNRMNIILDSETSLNTDLQHAVLGRYIAYDRFCITDIDILNAIRYHTTGRVGMSLLEKIVYLADAIESKREYEGIDEIRKMAYKDIDVAMVMSIVNTCSYLNRSKIDIHKNTIDCLEWLEKKTTGGNNWKRIGKELKLY